MTRVMNLAQKCVDVDAVRKVITVEQLLNSMPVGRLFTKSRGRHEHEAEVREQ